MLFFRFFRDMKGRMKNGIVCIEMQIVRTKRKYIINVQKEVYEKYNWILGHITVDILVSSVHCNGTVWQEASGIQDRLSLETNSLDGRFLCLTSSYILMSRETTLILLFFYGWGISLVSSIKEQLLDKSGSIETKLVINEEVLVKVIVNESFHQL